MENFTPFSAILGGVLIGTSAILLLAFNGRIAGISGILFGATSNIKTAGQDDNQAKSIAWRWYFLAGLIIGAASYLLTMPLAFTLRSDFPMELLALSGFLVGYGTQMGSGCTSGHGVCGLARLSKRSIVATLTFLLVAMLTVFLIRHLAGLEL